MAKYGFRSKRVAETLRDFANERVHRAQWDQLHAFLSGGHPGLRSFIVLFDDNVPAASENEDGTWELGVGVGVVWARENPDNRFSQMPENAASSSTLVPIRDEAGLCLRKRVYNTLQSEIPSCVPIECVQDQDGDLYVSLPSDTEATTSSTTTTQNPQLCSGRCKWIWEGSYWVLDEDNCEGGTTTSTTTSSTTTTDTTTTTSTTTSTSTTEDCNCPTVLGSTTTSTTTTTTDCHCTYPLYCGQVIGECTYTFCSPYQSGEPNVECTSTTTTSSTTTTDDVTTTTCDCNTTTTTTGTVHADCADGCDWVWIQTSPGNFAWANTFNGCLSINCLPCPQPDASGASDCETAHTECSTTTTTPEPDPPTCGGVCTWFWIPELGDWFMPSSSWVQCSTAVDCDCLHPSDPPSDPNSACHSTTTPCTPTVSSTTTTSTTLGPCGDCYTTTSTTSTTSTTPEADCLNHRCLYAWTGSDWNLVFDGCGFDCSCDTPPFDGHDICETAEAPCITPTTTTSTTSSTTTSETTTTTTSSTTTSETTTTTCDPMGVNGGGCGLQCAGGVIISNNTDEFCPNCCTCIGPGPEFYMVGDDCSGDPFFFCLDCGTCVDCAYNPADIGKCHPMFGCSGTTTTS